MDFFSLFLIAVGLSMDAFAVAVANGMINHSLSRTQRLFVAITFGGLQGLMPVIGYLAGSTFSASVRAFDHWIALVLLGFIGGRMIRGSFSGGEGSVPELFSCRLVLLQGVATSIDALAMGVSFAFLRVNIAAAAWFIAAVTFVCSLAGVRLGQRCGGMLRTRAELFGGCVLVLIGLKVFLEHCFGRG